MTSRGWEIYTRQVRPLQKKKPKPEAPAEKKNPPVLKKPEAGIGAAMPEDIAKPLERRREKNFLRGEILIESILDLHGMTQNEAFDALRNFLSGAIKNKKRNLLVITGKGKNNSGVLRKNFENWIRDIPESSAILALRPGAQKHGGAGAFYVVLRKSGR